MSITAIYLVTVVTNFAVTAAPYISLSYTPYILYYDPVDSPQGSCSLYIDAFDNPRGRIADASLPSAAPSVVGVAAAFVQYFVTVLGAAVFWVAAVGKLVRIK